MKAAPQGRGPTPSAIYWLYLEVPQPEKRCNGHLTFSSPATIPLSSCKDTDFLGLFVSGLLVVIHPLWFSAPRGIRFHPWVVLKPMRSLASLVTAICSVPPTQKRRAKQKFQWKEFTCELNWSDLVNFRDLAGNCGSKDLLFSDGCGLVMGLTWSFWGYEMGPGNEPDTGESRVRRRETWTPNQVKAKSASWVFNDQRQ